MKNQFMCPPADYRGKPFWAWNGELDKDELIRQVHLFKQMGFGGFFMHSRTGLETEYLGKKWFECIRLCAAEAHKIGLEAWIYDEDRWPSGSAGGLVTKNPRYRMKFISCRQCAKDEFSFADWGQNFIAAFAVRFEGGAPVDYFRISDELQVKTGYEVAVFFVEEMEQSDFYNGYTYLDTLNADATREYIRSTHEKYKAECGDMLGKEIKGIFTDEPHRGCIFGGFALSNGDRENLIPYTYTLFEQFEKRKGYRLEDWLPEVYFGSPGQGFCKAAYDYTEVLQQLFLENFAAPYYEWCRANNILVTGHILHEDSLTSQSAVSGSVMRYYEYMDYPGIDILSEHNRSYWVVKQAKSVANQLGKPFVLSELYGCTGWQMKFENYKFAGDWQAALGVNLRCHHLSWYSMKGEAKRDYPASIFYQSAWHQKFSYVEDYFSRINRELSQGKPVVKTLVINPVESVWGYLKKGAVKGLEPNDANIIRLEKSYKEMFHALVFAGVDFDYADEEHLSRNAKTEGGSLKLGEMSYSTVVLSGLDTVRSSTLKVLQEFCKSGGTVLTDGLPSYADGVRAEFDQDMFRLCRHGSEIAGLCKTLSPVSVQADGVISNVRETESGYTVFLLNTDTSNPSKAILSVTGSYFAEQYDCRSGDIYAAECMQKGGVTTLTCLLERGGERLYKFSKTPPAQTGSAEQTYTQVKLPEKFDYELLDDNILVCDIADYYIDGKHMGRDEILNIDRSLRDIYRLKYRGGEMLQPWYRKKYFGQDSSKPLCNLKLEYTFEVNTLPGSIEFVCENSGYKSIVLNGRELKPAAGRRFIDKDFTVYRVESGWIKTGVNKIELSCLYFDAFDLEACYLTGKFGVEFEGGTKTITALPAHLDTRPLHGQGMPFYSGRIKLFTGIKGEGLSCRVSMPKMRCAYVEADFGGQSEIIAFPPYRTQTRAVTGELTLTLCATRRNTFGPLHAEELDSVYYGPDSFIVSDKKLSGSYNFYDEGFDMPLIEKLQK